MTNDLRQFPRKEVEREVELRYLDDAPRSSITRDVSDGGLFIKLHDIEHYLMGEIINLNYKNPLDSLVDTQKDAIIVRKTEDGIGVAFIEMGDS